MSSAPFPPTAPSISWPELPVITYSSSSGLSFPACIGLIRFPVYSITRRPAGMSSSAKTPSPCIGDRLIRRRNRANLWFISPAGEPFFLILRRPDLELEGNRSTLCALKRQERRQWSRGSELLPFLQPLGPLACLLRFLACH